MKVVDNDAIDRFFQYIASISTAFKIQLTRIEVGDFSYYDCDEIIEKLKPKQKKHWLTFMERNPLQIHEYNEDNRDNKTEG